MIREFVNTFNAREGELKEFFAAHEPKSYYDIVFAVAQLLHGDSPLLPEKDLCRKARSTVGAPNPGAGLPDPLNISEIDDGNWQGSLIYLVPADVYQPTEKDYWFCSVSYGSCPFCDLLEATWALEDQAARLDDYMSLAIGVLEGLKPLDGGTFYGNATNLSWIARDLVADAEARQDSVAMRLADAAWEAKCELVVDKADVSDRVRYETLSILARRTAAPAARRGDAIKEAVSNVKNALRFAFILPLGDFADRYWILHDEICKQGFTFVSSDNRFVNDDDVWCIGIVACLQDADGFTFEVQFHTRDSYEFALVTGQFMDVALHLDARRDANSGTNCCNQLRRLRESIEIPDGIYLSIRDIRESNWRSWDGGNARKPMRRKTPLPLIAWCWRYETQANSVNPQDFAHLVELK